MTISEGKLRRMKALSNARGVIAAAAMDQRGSLQKSLAVARGVDMKEITHDMMSEFKVAVTRILTPHASAILLDPEFGLDAARVRASNAGLLLAYELSGYDNTRPGRLPDLLPHVSVKRIADWGADAVKILIYLSAGVSNAQFTESLKMASEAGTDYCGVLCGRATWKEGVPVYAKQGLKALEDWLQREGVRNINAVNDAIQSATPWHAKAGLA